MFKSAVTEPPIPDWHQHPDAIAAQTVRNAAKDALDAARAHHQELFQQQQTGDELVRYRATLDLPAAERTIWEKELEMKAAEQHLNAVEIQVKPAVQAAWKSAYIPACEALFDALRALIPLHERVVKIQGQAKQIGNVHLSGMPIFSVLNVDGMPGHVSWKVGEACRELGMSPDRWLPLQ